MKIRKPSCMDCTYFLYDHKEYALARLLGMMESRKIKFKCKAPDYPRLVGAKLWPAAFVTWGGKSCLAFKQIEEKPDEN